VGVGSGNQRFFYGWYIVAACFVILVFNPGARCAFSVMFKPIIGDFGVIESDPRQLGLRPLDSVEIGGQGSRAAGEAGVLFPLRDIGLKDAIKTSAYLCCIVVMFICGRGDYLVTTALIPLATDSGISPLSAGNMLGWYWAMSLVVILIAGPLSDRIGTKIPVIMTFALKLPLYLLIRRFKTVWSFYIFVFFSGFTHLITAPLTPVLIGGMFGNTHLGLLSGFVNTIHFLGGGLWDSLAGDLDRMGSYQLALQVSAVTAIVAILAGVFIAGKRHSTGDSRVAIIG
jgi:hypothetical protein